MGKSLSKFIREHCANWANKTEACIGLDAFGKTFREPGQCWVIEGRPCEYFKNSVLGSEDNKHPHVQFVKDPAFEKRVWKQYQKIDATVNKEDARRCPDCGVALRRRQKDCKKCKKKRRQD